MTRCSSLDLLDRLTVLYLTLPLAIFLVGWTKTWVAVPLVLCLTYSLRSLAAPLPSGARWPPAKLAVVAILGCVWTLYGGTFHLVYANADWHLRDAVLHDLVAGVWPVGYGELDGRESLLRAPLGYYLPAALVGKAAGLVAAHAAMALWTAAGVVLFLLQVLPARGLRLLVGGAVIVLFSGLDVIGTLQQAPQALAHWDITRHLEWWAGSYQYSSMTTQLFWVPNHALGGWLTVGLLMRSDPESSPAGADRAHETRNPDLDALLPMIVAALALWSPLTALGAVPFVLHRLAGSMWRERSLRLAHPRVWGPALAVGTVIAAYLTLDAARIPRGWTIGRSGAGVGAVISDLLRHAEFFLLEAGLIGAAILAIRPSRKVVVALAILLLLPLVSFGAANDFVMRVSIPSLALLAVAACRALTELEPKPTVHGRALTVKRGVLAALLAVGAVTPFQEFARAAVLERWPINLDATLVSAACGRDPPHYVARLAGQAITHVLRLPHALPPDPRAAAACSNPALSILKSRVTP